MRDTIAERILKEHWWRAGSKRAAKYGVVFSPPGSGVSHHIHRQQFGVPGRPAS